MKTPRLIAVLGCLVACVFAAGPMLGAVPVLPPTRPLAAPSPADGFNRYKNWHVRYQCEKWTRASDFHAGKRPNAVVTRQENLLLNGGINQMLQLLTGTGGTAYSSANARIKVGNSTTAAANTQTDLQGGSVAEATMDSTFPQVTAQTATWKSTFGSGVANHAWEEVTVLNGASPVSGSVVALNRKVATFGVKASGSVWTMTVTVSIS